MAAPLDLQAWMTSVKINDKQYLRSQCTEITLGSGVQPAECKCVIPFNQAQDRVSQELVTDGGLIDDILIGNKLLVEGGVGDAAGIAQFFGRVVETSGGIYDDIINVVGWDLRWDLSACPIIGSFWKSGLTEIVYREGIRPHFNKGGYPNLIWVAGKPVFCQLNYGLTEGGIIPLAKTCSNTQAAYWDCGSQLLYYYYCFDSTPGSWVAKARKVIPWYPAKPQYLTWGVQYYGIFDIEGERKSREAVVEGFNVLQAIMDTCKQAGHYAPDLTPKKDGVELTIVSTRYNTGDSGYGNGKKSLKRPSSITDWTEDICTNGSVVRDGRLLHTVFAVNGANEKVETRIQTPSVATINSIYNAKGILTPPTAIINSQSLVSANTGYNPDFGPASTGSTGRMRQFEEYVLWLMNVRNMYNLGGTITYYNRFNAGTAVAEAFKQFPDIAESWRVPDSWGGLSYPNGDNPLKVVKRLNKDVVGTWADCGHEILPSLLSRYISNSGLDNTTYHGNLSNRIPIAIEYLYDDQDYYDIVKDQKNRNWLKASPSDGMAVDHQGIIHLSGLRETNTIGISWKLLRKNGEPITTSPTSGDAYTNLRIKLTEYRMSVAFPLDTRLNQARKLAVTENVPVPSTEEDDNRGGDPHSESLIDPNLVRTHYADASRLAHKEYRQDSWPVPESVVQLLYKPNPLTPNNPIIPAIIDCGTDPAVQCNNPLTPPTVIAPNSILVDNSDLVTEQVIKTLNDLGRLDKAYHLIIPHINPTIVPGMYIEKIDGPSPITVKCCVNKIIHKFTNMQQQTILLGG
jgi:hypothetical protein